MAQRRAGAMTRPVVLPMQRDEENDVGTVDTVGSGCDVHLLLRSRAIC